MCVVEIVYLLLTCFHVLLPFSTFVHMSCFLSRIGLCDVSVYVCLLVRHEYLNIISSTCEQGCFDFRGRSRSRYRRRPSRTD